MKNFSFCDLVFIAVFLGTTLAQMSPQGFLQYRNLKKKAKNHRAEITTTEETQKTTLNIRSYPLTSTEDEKTGQKMKRSICGVSNFNKRSPNFRPGSKWPTDVITWKISKYSKTSALSRSEQKRAIIRGINRWSEVTPLIFKETKGKAHIDISFEKGYHGDVKAFDGEGGALGHAFYPLNGKTHFDDDETWINGETGGINLETVAAHEIGHALGLGHSNNQKSLMSPQYQIFPDDFKLNEDDVANIQKLYGPAVETTKESRLGFKQTPKLLQKIISRRHMTQTTESSLPS